MQETNGGGVNNRLTDSSWYNRCSSFFIFLHLGWYVVTNRTPTSACLLPTFNVWPNLTFPFFFFFFHLWINDLLRVSPLQKQWFYILCIFIKVLFIRTNIAQSQSLTINDGIFIRSGCEEFQLSWWQSIVLVCKSVIIEQFSRLTLRSKNATLFLMTRM